MFGRSLYSRTCKGICQLSGPTHTKRPEASSSAIKDCGSHAIPRPLSTMGLSTEARCAVKTVWTGRLSSRSEEHTSELQSLMRISYAVFCLKKKQKTKHV